MSFDLTEVANLDAAPSRRWHQVMNFCTKTFSFFLIPNSWQCFSERGSRTVHVFLSLLAEKASYDAVLSYASALLTQMSSSDMGSEPNPRRPEFHRDSVQLSTMHFYPFNPSVGTCNTLPSLSCGCNTLPDRGKVLGPRAEMSSGHESYRRNFAAKYFLHRGRIFAAPIKYREITPQSAVSYQHLHIRALIVINAQVATNHRIRIRHQTDRCVGHVSPDQHRFPDRCVVGN